MAYNWEDYSSSSYKRKYKSSYYQDDDDYYGGSKWNWGNYGGSLYGSSYLEDGDDLYIKPHTSYFTPRNEDFQYKLNYQSNTKSNRDLIKEMSRFFYYRMLDDKDYFDEKYADPTKLSDKDLEIFNSKKATYDDLWDKEIPGISPLDKALFVFSQLEQKDGSKGNHEASLVRNVVQEIKVNSKIYGDAIYNELLDSNEFSKKYKFDILNKISLVQNLGGEFKIQKETEEKIVPNSHIRTNKLMRDYSQMYSVEFYQRLMPNFPTKLLTKDLIVNVPIDRTESKQKIVFLEDFSGSMNTPEKQTWVNAVLIDRLRYCIKEEAEVFFSYFLHDTKYMKFTHIYNRETAIEFWKTFSNYPSGGNTALGVMVNFIKDEIETHYRLCNLKVDLSNEKVEILALSDGNDTVKTDKFTYKTNAITLVDSENPELKKLCLDNKGKYVYINGENTITYSESGVQKLKNK